MFGRRRRAASNPPINAQPPSASALTAASSAFLHHRSSSTSLAAAAAGAALRSRPTTPINVANVQTKRMVRRGSNSSAGSAPGSLRERPGPQLERRGSSGSMSERTFRDPSPGRGSPLPDLADAPPVPAIPKDIQTAGPAKSHRRAASAEAPAMRVASPPPNKATGRGSSLGPTGGQRPAARGRQRMTGLSSVQEQTGLERPESRGASQQNGVQQKSNLVYDPNTRSFISESQVLFEQQRIQDAAERPVKKKRKKRVAPPDAAGTHLAAGTVGGRPKGTAVAALEAAENRPTSPVGSSAPVPVAASPTGPVVATASPQKAKPKTTKQTVRLESSADSSALSDVESDVSDRPHFKTRAGMLLAKKPSVITEQDEEEEDATRILSRQATLEKLESGNTIDRGVSPVPLPQVTAGRGHGRGAVSVAAATPQPSRSASQPPVSLGVTANGRAAGSVRADRVQSVSPARTAHFSSTPESSNLSVKHDPPPRSISPRKSALKQSPSPRGSSPMGDGSGSLRKGHGSIVSEASDTSTNISEGALAVPKKKSARVSFDDESNIILGESAPTVVTDSPVISSPQRRKGWFSRGKKTSSVFDDDDDQVMKPRPALPAFGSVREKKNRDFEERSLVQPAEPRETTPPQSPIFTTATGETIEYPMGSSLDHGIGAVLAQDHSAKTEAYVSRSQEPVPPEVTSVEGSGYISDESETSTAETKPPQTEATTPVTTTVIAKETHDTAERPVTPTREVEHDVSDSQLNGSVPIVAITQATPILEDIPEFFNVPGGFPSDASDSGADDHEKNIVEHRVTDPTPADMGIAEPKPVSQVPGSPSVGSIAAENISHSPIIEEPEESDRDSIYSDAAEDLSDLEGDGFMSLDAVVDSPVQPPSKSPFANETPPESPTGRHAKEKAYRKSQLSRKSSAPGIDQGWDKAQEYWAGLTMEKKRELELQALEKTGEDSADSEADFVALKPVPKPTPKRKKKVVVAPPGEEPFRSNDPVPSHQTDRTYQIIPGQKAPADGLVPSLRSSMRATPSNVSDDVQMRKTMRNGAASGGRSMRGSMRGSSQAAPPPEPKGSLQKKHRPMSIPSPETAYEPILSKKQPHNLSAGAASAAASVESTIKSKSAGLHRTGSDASDSSFRRARPPSEGYSMRTSMRGSSLQARNGRPQTPDASQLRSSRFSLRSLSPTGSTYRRPFSSSSAQPPTITTGLGRTTMRNRAFSNEMSAPTLRATQPDRTRSPLPSFGFGRSKAATKAKAAPPKRASRFGDSSDEEDTRPAYRSRFVDSSDEEDDTPVRTLPEARMTTMRSTPVRAIPRRNDVVDGDSSDLPDTDDEKPTPKSAVPGATPTTSAGGHTLRRSGSGRDFLGSPVTTTSTGGGQAQRSEQKRRGSFMSMLRRKKPDGESKVRKSTLDSAARRDTPLERSKPELDAMKRQDSSFSATSNGHPKLQKRNTGSRASPTMIRMPAEWPLGRDDPPLASQMQDSEGRPMTSDGITTGRSPTGSPRPGPGTRRVTGTGLPGFDSIGTDSQKRKKKFGMLRKAFGLDL